jgi:hypothetical protein
VALKRHKEIAIEDKACEESVLQRDGMEDERSKE